MQISKIVAWFMFASQVSCYSSISSAAKPKLYFPRERWAECQPVEVGIDEVFGESLDNVIHERLSSLQFEDDTIFGSRGGLGVNASARDFARIGLLWLHRGSWNGAQVIDRKLFEECVCVGVPIDTVRTMAESTDYLRIGTYGGGTDQTVFGPVCYGFNFWFNASLKNSNRVWPALPADAFQANGLWNRDTVTVIPSLEMVIAARRANPGKFEPGKVDSDYNRNLRLISDAVVARVDKTTQMPQTIEAIDLSPFASGISHWRNLRDDTRFIQALPGQPSYAASQVHEIVKNIMSFQRANGGWPKDYDMTAILNDDQRSKVVATHSSNDASYDNGNIHSQINYLARAYVQSNEPSWRSACERGLDFMLRSQYANGGFPQRFPDAKGFHAHITFNDGVMIGLLKVLREAARQAPHFAWLDETRRTQAEQAVTKATQCILQCQIRVDGKRTGWCQQHDEQSLQAMPARSFELASICPQETTEIIRFLMQQPDSPATKESIDAAKAWLTKVQLSGIAIEKFKTTREEFLRHTVDFDVRLIEDTNAPPLWARHYEIGTNRPIFAGRDGIKKYSFDEIERERRTGTAWYGRWPTELLSQ